MKETCYQWVPIILAFLVATFFQITVIPNFIRSWRKKIKKFIESVGKSNGFPKKLEEELKESLEQAYLIEKREEELCFITQWVSFIELVAFGGLTVLIFNEEPSLSALNTAKIFGAFLGGWLGIKILSNHRPWSDKVAGKAYYHTSLIGTLLNVGVSFIVGFLVHIAWFN